MAIGDVPQKCPNCGRCPTCGHTPLSPQVSPWNPWVQPYYPYQPWQTYKYPHFTWNHNNTIKPPELGNVQVIS